eukprot:365375-Chlamydomonas_euryale.AAC.11
MSTTGTSASSIKCVARSVGSGSNTCDARSSRGEGGDIVAGKEGRKRGLRAAQGGLETSLRGA